MQAVAQAARMSGDECYHMLMVIGMLRAMYVETLKLRSIQPLVIGSSFLPLAGVTNFGGPPRPSNGDLFNMLNLRIPFPTLEQVSALPAEQIVEFHDKHGNSRRRFRDRIEASLGRLAKTTDISQLVAVAKAEGEAINEEVNSHVARLDELRVGRIYDLLSVGKPSLVAGGGALLATHDPAAAVIFGTVGLGIGVVNWLGKTRAEVREWAANSSMHYLLETNKLVEKK
jgi:hypothetical protein